MNIVREEKFNSNNSWGFGGGIGTYTYYDNGFVFKKFKAYYRHMPSTSHKALLFEIDDDLLTVVSAKVAKKSIIYAMEKLPTKGQVFTLMVNETGYQMVVEGDHEVLEANYHTYTKVKNITA